MRDDVKANARVLGAILGIVAVLIVIGFAIAYNTCGMLKSDAQCQLEALLE